MIDKAPNTDEIEELKSLMADFPVIDADLVYDPVLAWKDIQSIYLILEEYGSDELLGLNQLFNKPGAIEEKDVIEVVKLLHKCMFSRVLSCAGEFRNSSDPNSGQVYFGKNQKYSGSSPQTIEEELKKASSYLVKTSTKSDNAIEAAICFYQHFVWVHPFYDGNGRVARLLVNAFLNEYQLFIDWNSMNESQDKFLKKLNSVHNRMDSKFRYKEYAKYLVKYIKKFIKPFNFYE